MAGVGKSPVAARVARELCLPRVDIDAAVARTAGASVQQIFAERGESAFRRLETDSLCHTLNSEDSTVIATGGGAVCAIENREALAASAVVVWLRSSAEVLIDRLQRSATRRPLLDGDLSANVQRLLREREDRYQEAADIIVDVEHEDVAEVSTMVIEKLRLLHDLNGAD